MKIRNPETMLFNHGKSFHFASQVFSKKVFIRVTYLYAFCRFVDDTADEQSLPQAQVDLQKISSVLNSQKLAEDEFSNQDSDLNQISLFNLIQKLESYGIQKPHLKILVEGALFDVNKKTIQTQSDLIRYCFHVAGVVGLMMCPLIFVKNKKAHAFAIDLGIGMQLTNICRDILEDAQNGRIYLPAHSLKENNLNLLGLVAQQGSSLDSKNEFEIIKLLVKKQLDIADVYYKSSFKGLSYIPLRPRLAILLASNIYRAIGNKIRKNNYNVLSGRTYLSKPEKIWVSIKAFIKVFHINFWMSGHHDSNLHIYIKDLITSPELLKQKMDFNLHNMDFSAGYQTQTTENRNEQNT